VTQAAAELLKIGQPKLRPWFGVGLPGSRSTGSCGFPCSFGATWRSSLSRALGRWAGRVCWSPGLLIIFGQYRDHKQDTVPFNWCWVLGLCGRPLQAALTSQLRIPSLTPSQTSLAPSARASSRQPSARAWRSLSRRSLPRCAQAKADHSLSAPFEPTFPRRNRVPANVSHDGNRAAKEGDPDGCSLDRFMVDRTRRSGRAIRLV